MPIRAWPDVHACSHAEVYRKIAPDAKIVVEPQMKFMLHAVSISRTIASAENTSKCDHAATLIRSESLI